MIIFGSEFHAKHDLKWAGTDENDVRKIRYLLELPTKSYQMVLGDET
jgi:hypothetical protein